MKKFLGVGLAVGMLLAGIGCVITGTWAMSSYNGLVVKDEAVKAAWAQVENQMQRRLDLIPNLVETVKGYAGHENALFTQIASFRAQALSASGGIAGRIQGMQGVNRCVGGILSLAENYPQLQASPHFVGLRDELIGTENRLAVERKRFNEAVQAYNVACRRMPGALVARLAGFEALPQFEATAAAHEAPKVRF